MHGSRWVRLLIVVQVVAALVSPLATPTRIRAQQQCGTEIEPNDAPETAQSFTGAGCFTGELPDNDQDIWLWTVAPEDALTRWTFELTGVARTITGLKIVQISSDPGVTPITAGSELIALSTAPDDKHPSTLANVLIAPGTYILGVSRSDTADNTPG